jgi:hypothetical protein
MRFQPITTQEVASLLVTLSQEKALDGIVEAGGPEVRDFESLAKAYLDIKGYDRPIKLVNTDHPRHRLFRTGINLCPDRKVGQITWEQYLESVL